MHQLEQLILRYFSISHIPIGSIISLHFPQTSSKCRQMYHTWIVWDHKLVQKFWTINGRDFTRPFTGGHKQHHSNGSHLCSTSLNPTTSLVWKNRLYHKKCLTPIYKHDSGKILNPKRSARRHCTPKDSCFAAVQFLGDSILREGKSRSRKTLPQFIFGDSGAKLAISLVLAFVAKPNIFFNRKIRFQVESP